MTNPQLTVRSVVVRCVDVPMRMPLHTSSGALTSAPLVLIDLETSAGTVGRAYLFAFTRGNMKPIAALVQAMGEMVVGDPVAPFEIERKLRQKYALLGVHNIVLIAMSGIDMAAWDAHAQHPGQPLARVLGGTVRPMRAYNSNGPRHHADRLAGGQRRGAGEGRVRRREAAPWPTERRGRCRRRARGQEAPSVPTSRSWPTSTRR